MRGAAGRFVVDFRLVNRYPLVDRDHCAPLGRQGRGAGTVGGRAVAL